MSRLVNKWVTKMFVEEPGFTRSVKNERSKTKRLFFIIFTHTKNIQRFWERSQNEKKELRKLERKKIFFFVYV